jgi:hypothetical protein
MTNYMNRFENVEAMKSEPMERLPEGTYKAKISDIEIKEQAFPEATKISVEFTVDDGEFTGRKTWWNTTLSEQTTDKAFSFIKGQICKMAGVDSTNGNPLDTLTNARGNVCEIDLTYKPGTKDPSKTYAQVYTNKMILPF